jgi:hypothetical protein
VPHTQDLQDHFQMMSTIFLTSVRHPPFNKLNQLTCCIKDLNYVISYGYTACYAQDDEQNFIHLMRHIWVPNAMSKVSLMNAVFHVACRNYVTVTNNSLSSKFGVKKLQYRLMCIQMAKDAIESETVATDTTIALSMLMASEAVSIPFYFSFLLFIFGKRLT